MKNTLIAGLVVTFILVVGVLLMLSKQSKKQNNPASPLEKISNQQDTESVGGQPTDQSQVITSTKIDESKNNLLLIINQPQSGQTVTGPNYSVTGKTVPNAQVAVNDQDLTADSQGFFTASLTLDEGENIISILVNDELGNMAEKEIVVTYEP